MTEGRRLATRPAGGAAARALRIPPIGLEGTLSLPAGAEAVILFAHGSGSSRFSPRNRMVADGLEAVVGLARDWFADHLTDAGKTSDDVRKPA